MNYESAQSACRQTLLQPLCSSGPVSSGPFRWLSCTHVPIGALLNPQERGPSLHSFLFSDFLFHGQRLPLSLRTSALVSSTQDLLGSASVSPSCKLQAVSWDNYRAPLFFPETSLIAQLVKNLPAFLSLNRSLSFTCVMPVT